MSLKIWLPLDGDLRNLGCSGYNITSFETPTYTTGKIGQCYQRMNSNTQSTNGINIDDNLVEMLGTQASVAVWVKPLGTHTHYNGTIISSGNWNAKKWAFGVSQDNSQVDVLCGSYNNYISCSVPVNEWTHLVSTFNNGTCKLYKNGIYIGEKTGQAAFVSDATNTCIGRETYASGYFGFNGLINDVRIYDHCLSAAEVREIAMGLVLHYKLDGGVTDSTIVSDSSGYGHNGTIIGNPTINSDTIKYSSCTNFPTNVDGILSTFPLALWNNAFTYSFWIKPSGENGGRSIYAASYNGVSCSIEKTAGNKLRFYWNGSPDLTTSSLTITDGIWQHIAIVKSEDKTKVYCYYNGELKDIFTNTFSDKTFSGNLRIARDTRGDATSYTGLMSDFRIYCTPLLDTDIKLLYNTNMRVDNLGGIHTFEFDEISNEKLLKTGILQTNELEETSIQLARLQKNKGWLSSEFIEI